MKKIIMWVFFIMAAGILVSCNTNKEEMDSYSVYYLNQDMTGLEEGTMELPHKEKDSTSVVADLLKQLQTAGGDANLKSPISENVDILDYEIKNHQIAISFSAAYYERSGVEETLSRAAVVETLCQLSEINYVEFYVEDQPLMLSGNAVGPMNSDDFVQNLDALGKERSRQVTLYLSNQTGDKLRAVTASVTYNAATPLAELLINELIQVDDVLARQKGKLKGVKSAIPKETVVNHLTIRDQICYVDLGSGFNDLLAGISSEVTVYSIVNTLCELSNVNRVQFTIDGEPQEQYGEMDSFHSVLERNLDIVESEND